jgi:hypothetical protein
MCTFVPDIERLCFCTTQRDAARYASDDQLRGINALLRLYKALLRRSKANVLCNLAAARHASDDQLRGCVSICTFVPDIERLCFCTTHRCCKVSGLPSAQKKKRTALCARLFANKQREFRRPGMLF